MKILSHRGYWRERGEQNRRIAFERSFELGFGTETDLRDHGGGVVIAHDPPTAAPPGGEEPLSLDDVLTLAGRLGPDLPLALNVKADGLQRWVRDALDRAGTRDAFVFDMSVPDTLGWLAAGVAVLTRHSEVEPEPVLLDRAAGVWLDQFYGDWVTRDVIARHLDAGRRVCLVSPDLHRRGHRPQWEALAATDIAGSDGFMLCTDFPEDARMVFHG